MEYYKELFPNIPDKEVYNGAYNASYPWSVSQGRFFRATPQWEPTYESFALALSILCVRFQDYVLENGFENDWGEFEEHDPGSEPRFWWGPWDVGNLSTVFGFTSTEDNPKNIHEYMKRFGFHGQKIGDSEKYRGSVVTLWSMPARKFAEKCKEIYDDARERYGERGDGKGSEGVGSQAA